MATDRMHFISVEWSHNQTSRGWRSAPDHRAAAEGYVEGLKRLEDFRERFPPGEYSILVYPAPEEPMVNDEEASGRAFFMVISEDGLKILDGF
jgi:hypothetical protein